MTNMEVIFVGNARWNTHQFCSVVSMQSWFTWYHVFCKTILYCRLNTKPDTSYTITMMDIMFLHNIDNAISNLLRWISIFTASFGCFGLYVLVDETLYKYIDRDHIFRLSPFVFFYGTVFDLDLVIDASDYGNDARFIRRSCQPNASVSVGFILQWFFKNWFLSSCCSWTFLTCDINLNKFENSLWKMDCGELVFYKYTFYVHQVAWI